MVASNQGIATSCNSLLGALLGLALCASAHAGLGGKLESVYSDQQAYAASTRQTAVAGATLYTQSLPGGVTVRQYVNASGQVFAVGWEGPVLPDFQRLLGPHFQTYSDAMRQQKRRVSIQRADLVLDAGGMMRSFGGRAYLPTELPPALLGQDIF